MEHKIKNLVVCSTLNQITNFIIIDMYKPENIFNITFDDDAVERFNFNIKPRKWDEYLKKECENFKCSWSDVKLSIEYIHNLGKLKNKLEMQIVRKACGEIYWHVTGGQRTIALAVSKLIGDKETKREKDKLIYVEGNTEELIVNNCDGEIIPNGNLNYRKKDLTFEQALNLTGFDTKNLESTIEFKKKGNKIHENDVNFIKEHKFYQKLYNFIVEDESKNKGHEIIKFESENRKYEGSFRNLLLYSNKIEKSTSRYECVEELFKQFMEKHKDIKEIKYDILSSKEIEGSYPAGYVFEKLAAHRIYNIVKDNPKVIEMVRSLKTYFNKKNKDDNSRHNIIDELDVVLLTDTGKIINFECKSSGMKSDNAKSNKYTTYRLAGVFGMPVLLSPLLEYEIKDNENSDDDLKSQKKAVRAAKAAELEVMGLDKLNEENFEKLFNI